MKRTVVFAASLFICATWSLQTSAQTSGSVTIASATAGAGIINVTVQYTTGTGWSSVGPVTVFAAKDGGTLSKESGTGGQLTFTLNGVRTGTYTVWAVLKYYKTGTIIVNGMETPGMVEHFLYSTKTTVNVTDQWMGNQNQLQPLPHATANIANEPSGSNATIPASGTITNIDANWAVAHVEIFAVISTGGTSSTSKQTYSPPTSTTPVAWSVSIQGLPAGTYTVYIITTLKKAGLDEYQQVMSGPYTVVLT